MFEKAPFYVWLSTYFQVVGEATTYIVLHLYDAAGFFKGHPIHYPLSASSRKPAI
jgi:hypothetical protein